jgi:hypothetical protein
MVDTCAASLIAEAVLKGITVSGLLGRRQRKILTVPRLVQTTVLRSTWRSTQATEDSPLVEGVDSLKRSV